MNRTHATVAITALVVLFFIGVIDQIEPPYVFANDAVLKTVGAILIGVTIALIVSGLSNGGGDDDT